MIKIRALVSLAAIVCLSLAGCGGSGKGSGSGSGNTATLVSITVTASNSATSMAAGQTLQMAATGNYSDGTSKSLTSQVTWNTSDSSLATASASGLITSYKQGLFQFLQLRAQSLGQ